MTQPNLLELAKQGDASAIASLMNRQLQPKGITVKVALKDACLQIMLESAQVPNQQALVAFVRKGIVGLGAASIERVKIYGRQTGEEFPAWNQEFELVVHASSTPSPINTDSTFSSEHNQQLESPVVTHGNLPSKIAPENLRDNNIYYEIEGSNGQIRLTHNRIIISQGLKGLPNKKILKTLAKKLSPPYSSVFSVSLWFVYLDNLFLGSPLRDTKI